MMFDDLVRELAAPTTDPGDRWWLMAGVVTTVNATTPPTVNVDLAGGAVEPLRYAKGSAPAAGDTVWVACKGSSAMFVAFVLA